MPFTFRSWQDLWNNLSFTVRDEIKLVARREHCTLSEAVRQFYPELWGRLVHLPDVPVTRVGQKEVQREPT